MISIWIKRLVEYGLDTGLLTEIDKNYATNQILGALCLDGYEEFIEEEHAYSLEEILKEILDDACSRGVIEDSIGERDLLDTKVMNCLMPRPSEISSEFWNLYKNQGKKQATDYYYKLSQDSDYIRRYRIEKDKKWVADTAFGAIDITINLSKPEKDPKAIAAAKNAVQTGYPKCLLCTENEGYFGRIDHPARNNHRVIPITINETPWGFQYSPYVYYNEHCIVFSGTHTPMRVERSTFVKLFDFVKLFPHYFLGSNADLPIVGGSILSHDHFQGGNYTFAMAKAPMEQTFTIKGFEEVEAGIVNWPMSVIRIRHKDSQQLVDLGEHILNLWRGYSDEEAFVFASTNGEPHNTITPIARMVGDQFELDLVLRNNITTEESPMGVYHPRKELHHIKKENIGLIEVMGLAVLPARLKTEMEILADYLVSGKDVSSHEEIEKHNVWAQEIQKKHTITKENVSQILEEEIGNVFVEVLEDAGVYKCDESGRKYFTRFIQKINESIFWNWKR